MTHRMIMKWLAVLLVLICAGTASAVTTVSTNTGAGYWSNASRWSQGVPVQTNNAVLAELLLTWTFYRAERKVVSCPVVTG